MQWTFTRWCLSCCSFEDNKFIFCYQTCFLKKVYQPKFPFTLSISREKTFILEIFLLSVIWYFIHHVAGIWCGNKMNPSLNKFDPYEPKLELWFIYLATWSKYRWNNKKSNCITINFENTHYTIYTWISSYYHFIYKSFIDRDLIWDSPC